MSFNFNPMNNTIPTMMPLLGNMPNGANFLPQLTANAAAAAAAMQQQQHHQHQMSVTSNIMTSIPGLNDSPLEFNLKKNQPPGAGPMDLEIANENDRIKHQHINNNVSNNKRPAVVRFNKMKNERDNRSSDRCDTSNSPLDSPDKNVGTSSTSQQTTTTSYNQNDLLYNSMMGIPQSLMMMPTSMINMMDPASMLSLQQFPLMGQINAMQQSQHSEQNISGSGSVAAAGSKELIKCKSCSLFPPNPNSPAPTTRERPPGCRTVFVGGLPLNGTEEIIREVFERCGEITTLRLSKKYFCHIRFAYEQSVDSAIYLSGYTIRVGNNTDAGNTGRLHVDFAQARDDQYEWECKQRQLQREQRHRERVERDRQRNLSPPPIVHYTDHEAATVSEKLKQDDNFSKAVQVLITWLERGDCSKKNSNTFYSMIQSTNSHVRRLQTEKTTFEEELDKAKKLYKKQIHTMAIQFTQIEKVFGAASHKKVWDHFTKAQRKNIDLWKKQSTEIRLIQLEEYHDDDEMDMSDDERDIPRGSKRMKTHSQTLQAENESLKTELVAYKTDADMAKSMLELDTDVREKQIKVLQETIRNLQTQLLENKTKEKDNLNKIVELEGKLKQANIKELLLKTKIVEAGKLATSIPATISSKSSETDGENCNLEIIDLEEEKPLEQVVPPLPPPPPPPLPFVDAIKRISVDEAKIIGLVSTFLVIHPFGASIDYIYSYVQRVAPQLRPKELEEIISRYETTFKEEVTGIGAKIERKWKFCGFDIIDDNII